MTASPVTADITYELPVDEIAGSTLNPRTLFDEEELQQLADSIKSHGLIEPIVVRPSDTTMFNGPKEPAKYTVVAGERRLRAARLAKLPRITAIVRTDLTDQQALEVTILENLQRRQLSPMDESAAIQSLRTHCGMKTKAIAAAIHRSQDSILEAIHRLDLPTDVQEQVRAGTIAPTAARALWRYRQFPAFLNALATCGTEQAWDASKYEQKLDQLFQYSIPADLPMVRVTDHYYANAQPKHDECKKCPFGARFGSWCVKPEHMAQLDRAADEARKNRIAAAIADAEKDGRTVVDLTKLSYGDYHNLSYTTPPPGCTSDCPCRTKGIDPGGADLTTICTDPKRFRKLQTAATKEQNKDKREALKHELEQLEAAVDAITEIGPTEITLIASYALQATTRAATKPAWRHAGDLIPDAAKTITSYEGRQNIPSNLAQLSPIQVAKITVEALCRQELDDAYNGYTGIDSTKLTRWLTNGAVPPPYQPYTSDTPNPNGQHAGDETTPEDVLNQWTSTDQQRTRILDWAEHQGITDAGILEETLNNQPSCTDCDPTAPMGADEECATCLGTGVDLSIPEPATP